MRLISLHEDAVRALERLRVPFDDVTPEGLWGSPYHLIGVAAEQRAVLESWNLEVIDITPDALAAGGEIAPQLKESWPLPKPRPTAADLSREPAAARPNHEPDTSDSEVPVPMHEEPKKHGDPFEREIVEREIVERAAQQAEARTETRAETPKEARSEDRDTRTASKPKASKGGTAVFAAPAAPAERQDPTRLRVSVGGKYREASVRQGKILLDGQTFDSAAAATKSVAPSKSDWVFWEYYDADAGKWRMLDRDWSPQRAS